jgi:hypothetical protein
MTTPLQTLLDELTRLSAAATKGPWYYWDRPDNDIIATGKEEGVAICALAGITSRPKDFAFIAFARNHADLLAELLASAIKCLQSMAGDPGVYESEMCDNDGQGCRACEEARLCLATLNQLAEKKGKG